MRTYDRPGKMLAAWLACLCWWLPAPQAFAAEPPAAGPPPSVWDVRLDDRGALRGQLVNLEAIPVAGREVELQRQGQPLARTTSGRGGNFEFAGLPAGVYQLRLESSAVTCRAWTATAAPPIARERLVVLWGPTTVRGQQPIHAIFRNPLFIGLVVAAAVAIPIAVHNANDDEPSGS